MIVEAHTKVHDHMLPHPVHKILVAVGSDTFARKKEHQTDGKHIENIHLFSDENIVHHVF
jgi:uncharacterized membrane protein